jgi:hypothetical protein
VRWAVLAVVVALTGCTAAGPQPRTAAPSPAPTVATATPTAAVVATTWPVPDDSLTPGAVTPGCTYPRPTSERAVTTTTKTTVAREYGYTGPAGLDHVEYDHRIPFSLCGSNGSANIWPESYDGVNQSTYTHNFKDELEAYAARQVRYHHWTLTYAQNVFRGDWRAGWCVYLGYPGVDCTDLPHKGAQ